MSPVWLKECYMLLCNRYSFIVLEVTMCCIKSKQTNRTIINCAIHNKPVNIVGRDRGARIRE